MSDSDDPVDVADAGDDLFGDDEAQSDKGRALSDDDLASDRGGGYGEAGEGDDDEPSTKDRVIMTIPVYRHRVPRPSDGKLQSLRVPKYLKWNPEEYKADTWTPGKWDTDNARSTNPTAVARFRRDPKGALQSNANMFRWSDGSVTMAIGDRHFEMLRKPLAPPADEPYQELQDAHYYTAAAHLASNSLLIVGRVTEQFTVNPNKLVEDDALERLQRRLAEAKSASSRRMIITTREDPELRKKQAEQAEKERMRAQRRRETAAARMDGLGGSGRYNGGRGGALTVGDLEGGRRGGAAGRKRGQQGGAGAAGRKRNRNPEYDSDDDLPAGARRVDDYVLDDFAVASDEEGSGEEGDGDEDDEELLDEDEDEEEVPRRKRQKTADAEDEDADGEADLDDDVAGPAVKSSQRRRHIIDDDDDDE